ncbi:MAG: hypothetical protein HYS44_02450 [Candidatus Niyogibacteria bacterium]|nr:hypothetical protein [Candidatus Niyogibacteria bacterium]
MENATCQVRYHKRMERALFAAFEGWQNRKWGAKEPGLEAWMKNAQEREARLARAAYHEFAGSWAKQKLGENFSPAHALILLAENETALFYAYEMKHAGPRESWYLKKAERWQYRQPPRHKTSAAALLLAGVLENTAFFVLNHTLAALSGGNASSAGRHRMETVASAAIERLIASGIHETTPPIHWWLEKFSAVKNNARLQRALKNSSNKTTAETTSNIFKERGLEVIAPADLDRLFDAAYSLVHGQVGWRILNGLCAPDKEPLFELLDHRNRDDDLDTFLKQKIPHLEEMIAATVSECNEELTEKLKILNAL